MTDSGERRGGEITLPPPPPLPAKLVDLRPAAWLGTGVWFVGFVVLLLLRLTAHTGSMTVLWTCAAGTVLGLLGLSIAAWQRSAGRRGSRGAQTGAWSE